MENESYHTIADPSAGLIKEKGSRFLAFAYPVKDEKEIQEKLEFLRKKYHDARHHCYAWRLGAEMKHFRTCDDGEPANSAGKPILGQIQAFKLTNILVAVVRYFGGSLLGVGRLTQAYKNASYAALLNAKIVKKYLYDLYYLKFRYSDMNEIMKIIKEMHLEYYDKDFKNNCEMKIRVPRPLSAKFTKRCSQNPEIKVELLMKE